MRPSEPLSARLTPDSVATKRTCHPGTDRRTSYGPTASRTVSPSKIRIATCMAAAYALILTLALALAPTSPANARALPPLRTGFVDDSLFHFSEPSVARTWLGRARQDGASFIRLNVYWNQITPEEREPG